MDNTNTDATSPQQNTNDGALDERGLDTTGGLALLKRLRDAGFEASDEKFSVALGRPVEEVAAWMQGSEPPDDDIIMKARGIAKERGIEIE
jgi:DNA-binding transcriptional regulator YiaG